MAKGRRMGIFRNNVGGEHAPEFLRSELLDECRRMEREAADRAATSFHCAQNELVAQARLRKLSANGFMPARSRLVFAAASVLALLGGTAILALVMRPSGPDVRLANARSIEARIMAAEAGSVIEIEAGRFETAMTVSKAVRLVAVNGVVRIGVNAAKSGEDE